MKRRRIRLSFTAKIVSALMCISLLSVGFASWWIIKMPENVTVDGSFTVYEVKDKEIKIDEVSLTTPTIVFGKPASTDVKSVWLIADDSIATESLQAKLTFTVKLADGDASTTLDTFMDGINVAFAPNEASKTAFDKAISDGFIAKPKITGKYTVGTASTNISEVTYENSTVNVKIPVTNANSVKVELTFTFGWGCGENPYDYYNKLPYNETNVKAAKDLLGAIKGLETAGYDITISGIGKN